jgi:hypothetical protein
MAKITATRKDVPLYEVVEHIVGDRGRPTGDMPEEWDEVAPDETINEAWDSALEKLIAAVRDGKLKVSGRRAGGKALKELRPGDFAEKAHNPFGDLNLDIECSGKRVLEFGLDEEATIFESKSDLCRQPEVFRTDLCADSGAEILKLWQGPKKPTAKAGGRNACKEWLVAERRAGPPTQTKVKYKAEAMKRFNVGSDQFRTAWDEAAKVAPSGGWGRAGRPKKSSGQ